jgi:tetratricopeptide (TPR) repeat protein
VLWILALAAYSNSFQAGLVFDNASLVAEDSRIQAATPQNMESILTGGYWDGSRLHAATAGLYRPLTTFSYLLNYAVLGNGPQPAGYHFVNFLLHAANVALVYALGMVILGETSPAWALAAIWGLHPLLTESVVNIVGRADLLAAFGVLAGLLCYVKSASAAGRRRVAWLAGLAAAQAIGLFSKENAVVLPGIMLLHDLIWRDRAAWRRRMPAYAAVALPFAAYFYLRSGLHTHMLIDFTDNPLVRAGFWTARLTAVKVVGAYLWLFLWPARLSVDYSYNAVPLFGWRPSNWEDAKTLMALAVCLGAGLLAILLAVRWRSTGKPLLFFLIFFFVALAPTSNLVVLIGSIMAERFLYLPSVGLAGCVVASIYSLGQGRFRKLSAAKPVAWTALAVVCLALTARTYARNFDWQDDRSLWTSAVDVSPEAARSHYNLAVEFERIRDRQPEAIGEYQAAVRIEPDFVEAHNNLANTLARVPGRLPEAIREYQAALRIRPDRAEAHFNLALALANAPGRLPEAIAEYQAALRMRPDYAEAHFNLANALAQTPSLLPQAIAEYRAALRIEPNLAEAHFNLGTALAQTPALLPQAIAEYETALRIRPDPQWQQTVDRLRAWLPQAKSAR